ncbi:MAG: heme exporter protein CcmB [Proteobacteria bacterium]|nr:heme exporter protein CcmB [Pseudomonadota bacterium]MBT4988384.1 heme exporter protein CcmB [Pseudomonadota bacterium]MBT5189871.1 heme exporter protein CcmB [Pseudomonadota bacterium]MBT6071103.1 heme exporter protein CcmB [Pseudomonadota bacterium]MBT6658456.1 heme exporter protein CcmB [Pseudomonadota bacterium]
MPSLIHAFQAVIKRDIRLAIRQPSEIAQPVVFFIIVVSVFPFGVGSNPDQLTAIGPGIVWVGALLATLLALDSLFRSDFDDGSLEQLILSEHPLSVLILGKILVHWFVTGLPLIIVTPLLGILLGLDKSTLVVLIGSLLLGTPTLSLVGAIGSALTISIRRAGLLVTLLVLPLYIPVLIFGAGAASAAQSGLPTAGHLYMLGAIAMGAIALAPIATSAALRISSE